jgi:hypothetical protein
MLTAGCCNLQVQSMEAGSCITAAPFASADAAAERGRRLQTLIQVSLAGCSACLFLPFLPACQQLKLGKARLQRGQDHTDQNIPARVLQRIWGWHCFTCLLSAGLMIAVCPVSNLVLSRSPL